MVFPYPRQTIDPRFVNRLLIPAVEKTFRSFTFYIRTTTAPDNYRFITVKSGPGSRYQLSCRQFVAADLLATAAQEAFT